MDSRAIWLALIALLTLLPVLAFAEPPSVTLTANLERPVCPEGQPVVLSLALLYAHFAGNPQLAQAIAKSLRECGHLSQYRVNVTATGGLVMATRSGDVPPVADFLPRIVSMLLNDCWRLRPTTSCASRKGMPCAASSSAERSGPGRLIL